MTDEFEVFSNETFTPYQFEGFFTQSDDSALSNVDPLYVTAPISDIYHDVDAKAGTVQTPSCNESPKDIFDFPGDDCFNGYGQIYCHNEHHDPIIEIDDNTITYLAVESIHYEEPIKFEPALDSIDEAVKETLPLFDNFPVYLLEPESNVTSEHLMTWQTLLSSASQEPINSSTFLSLDWEESLVTSPKPEVKIVKKSPKQINRGKACTVPNCTRRAQSNARCKAHGGGSRCRFQEVDGTNCTRSSQGRGLCRSHGGGKRCEIAGCHRGQQRKGLCYIHGGIRQCQIPACVKKDRGNGFCIAHGGGKRCQSQFGCVRAVRRGDFCHSHSNELLVARK